MDRLPLSARLFPLVFAAGWAVPAAAQDVMAVSAASGATDSADLNRYFADGGIAATASALTDPTGADSTVADPMLPGSLSVLQAQDAGTVAANMPPPVVDPWPRKFVINANS
jgi:hypothetical protein